MDDSNDRSGLDLSFEWIPRVLQRLSSPIKRLVFEVTVSSHLKPTCIPWASIDKIIDPMLPQFSELDRVEVLVKRGARREGSPFIYGGTVLAEIMPELPKLDLLGLLHCDTEGF